MTKSLMVGYGVKDNTGPVNNEILNKYKSVNLLKVVTILDKYIPGRVCPVCAGKLEIVKEKIGRRKSRDFKSVVKCRGKCKIRAYGIRLIQIAKNLDHDSALDYLYDVEVLGKR